MVFFETRNTNKKGSLLLCASGLYYIEKQTTLG